MDLIGDIYLELWIIQGDFSLSAVFSSVIGGGEIPLCDVNVFCKGINDRHLYDRKKSKVFGQTDQRLGP